jgi:hypothetical protein
MGLAERRAIKHFQDTQLPVLEKAIDDAAGFEVPLETDWNALAVDDYTHMYDEAFAKVYFQPIALALAEVAQDDMGREALKSGLKRIAIRNSADKYGDDAISFEDGVLTIDHHPVTNIDDIEPRKRTIVRLLEKAL